MTNKAFKSDENKIKQEKTESLSNLCLIIKPKTIKEKKGYIVKTRNFSYPLELDNLQSGDLTNIILQKGDILFSDSFSGTQKFYLINSLLNADIHPSSFLLVIRPISNKISPEYLFLYLQSNTAKKYFLKNKSGGFFPRIPISKLKELPIIIPDLITQNKSKNIFETLFLQQKENPLDRINRELFDKTIPVKPIQKELILEELGNLRIWKREIIEKIINEDFNELESCMQNKMFKSFLILAGSILEAFLLDWISEIENKNYFDINEKEFTLGHLIWEKLQKVHSTIFDSDLIKRANNIREKRNLVHPKVYFNSHDKLNEKICNEVLEDLKVIFNKRKIT